MYIPIIKEEGKKALFTILPKKETRAPPTAQ